MKITRVEYRKLESLGNYNNHSLGAHADVEGGEDPDDALESLKQWVDEQMRRERDEIARYEDSLADLKARWDKAKAFLEQHGVDTSKHDQDIPF